MARRRTWLTHLNDNQVLVFIDGLLDQGCTWDEIALRCRANKIAVFRWYKRRTKERKLESVFHLLEKRMDKLETKFNEVLERSTPIISSHQNVMYDAPPPPPMDMHEVNLLEEHYLGVQVEFTNGSFIPADPLEINFVTKTYLRYGLEIIQYTRTRLSKTRTLATNDSPISQDTVQSLFQEMQALGGLFAQARKQADEDAITSRLSNKEVQALDDSNRLAGEKFGIS